MRVRDSVKPMQWEGGGGLPPAPGRLFDSSACALAAEGVDGPRARDGFAAVPEAFGDEIFFTGANGNATAFHDQGIAALDD